jgi:hypothetical protein
MDMVLLTVFCLVLCRLCTLVVLAVEGRQVLKIFTTGFCLKGNIFTKMARSWGTAHC